MSASTYGDFWSYDSLDRNLDTGCFEGQFFRTLYQLKPGKTPQSTLGIPGHPGGYQMLYTSRFDLQSAANKPATATGHRIKNVGGVNDYLPVVF